MGIIKITGNAKRRFSADTIEFIITFVEEDVISSKALAIAQGHLTLFLNGADRLGIYPESIHLHETKLNRKEFDNHYVYIARKTITFRIPFNAALVKIIIKITKTTNIHISIQFQM